MDNLDFFPGRAFVHNVAIMTDHAAPTQPPSAPVYDAYAEQQKLTTALMTHPDPHVRLIAHMSNRQLGMSEQIREIVESQAALLEAVTELKRHVKGDVDSLSSRVGRLEDAAAPMI